MSMFEKILVPLDFSAYSTLALRAGCDLARRFGSSVTLLHVYDPVPYALPSEFELFSPEQQQALRAEIDKGLAAARRRAETAGVAAVQTERVVGMPAEEIVRCADQGSFDLIVIGTHGRRGFRRALLGSVAERVVRLASCPVLSVRGAEDLETQAEKVWPPTA